MKASKDISTRKKIAINQDHGFISVAAFVLLFCTILFYTETVMFQDQEVTALLITIYFLGGVYLGRYLVQIWAHKVTTVPKRLVVLLAVLTVVCLGWLLFYLERSISTNTYYSIMAFALPFLVLSLAIGICIKLFRTAIKNQLQTAKAQVEQSRSELHLLQSQLSPHFLFNTLNNMYGISITQPGKIPPLLLKLSELLRYSVYDTQELFVPLKNEIDYINNYIEFEKIRIGDRLVLNAAIEKICDTSMQIAPMLLIVFVENAFKHAKNSIDTRIIIDISLKVREEYILFELRNSFGVQENKINKDNRSSGLGLVNVSKRLDLLYSQAYELHIKNEAGFYNVMLQLKTK